MTTSRLLCRIVVGATLLLLPATAIAQITPEVTDCDRLAADPDDPDRVAPGVRFDQIDAERAITSCRDAVAKHPRAARLKRQLARALRRDGRLAEALVWDKRTSANAGEAWWSREGGKTINPFPLPPVNQEQRRVTVTSNRPTEDLLPSSPIQPTLIGASVSILFGTNREKTGTGAVKVQFSGERGGELSVGDLTVTVPKDHSLGFVERPWSLNLLGWSLTSSEDPTKHFVIRNISLLNFSEFQARLKARVAEPSNTRREVLVFVHGYNTSFEAAAYRTAQIAHDLQYPGVPLLYSWPSRGETAAYESDQNAARAAREYLRRFLELVTQDTSVETINIIAHSLGNDPVLEVLRDLANDPDPKPRFNQIVLAAPDIDVDLFRQLASTVAKLANGVSLYASANDRAMAASRLYAGGVPRAGDVPIGGPIVLKDMDTIDASAITSDILSLNHSGYADNRLLVEDIGRLLMQGVRPPSKRNVTLLERKLSTGTYWAYPP